MRLLDFCNRLPFDPGEQSRRDERQFLADSRRVGFAVYLASDLAFALTDSWALTTGAECLEAGRRFVLCRS